MDSAPSIDRNPSPFLTMRLGRFAPCDASSKALSLKGRGGAECVATPEGEWTEGEAGGGVSMPGAIGQRHATKDSPET